LEAFGKNWNKAPAASGIRWCDTKNLNGNVAGARWTSGNSKGNFSKLHI